MFETVVPEITGRRRSRRLWYELLPLSIALHVLVVAAAIAAAVWTVKFPTDTPRMAMMYSLEEAPPPPPPPPPAAPPKRVVQQIVPVRMPENVAPNVIPDQVPVLTNEQPQPEVEGVEGGVEGGVEYGVVGGDVHGVQGGVIGGIPDDAPPPPPPPPSDRVIVERDKSLPMYPVSQVYPNYPHEARIRNWEDSLVVRYVIGKNGRIKELTIIEKPQHDIFEEVTLRAIRNWRFKPLIQNGEAKEVVHEKTVYFKLEYNG